MIGLTPNPSLSFSVYCIQSKEKNFTEKEEWRIEQKATISEGEDKLKKRESDSDYLIDFNGMSTPQERDWLRPAISAPDTLHE